MFTRSEFNPCIENIILLENLSDSIKNKEIFLREVGAANCILGAQGYKLCHCKGGCKYNKCATRSAMDLSLANLMSFCFVCFNYFILVKYVSKVIQ